MKHSSVVIRLSFALALAAAQPLFAAPKRVASPVINDAVSIEFVSVPDPKSKMVAAGTDAWLDLDKVAHDATMKTRSTQVRKQFGARVVRAGGLSWGTATLVARLSSADGRSAVRIDGRPLSTAPLVIDAHVAVGATTVHTLEIEVSDTVAEGPLSASIEWEVTTE